MKYFLGIDLGTTKVAAVIADESFFPVAVASAPHNALLSAGENAAEQDVGKILDCLRNLVLQLPADLRKQVSAIGITGQMHSLLLMNGETVSPLVTWQDRRCDEQTLAGWNQLTGLILRNGFGGTTLARLAAQGQLSGWNAAATISDFIAATLCGNARIVTDPTHAASWGLYDASANCWNADAVKKLNIPLSLLPEIRPCGSVAGSLSEAEGNRLGLPAGIPVCNAIGDNQASILGTGIDFASEVYLTLGTGIQLSMVLTEPPPQISERVEIRPFPDGRCLLVAAPLCGGAAFAWLADTVNAFCRDLGLPEHPRGKLLDQLDALGAAELEKGEPELDFAPNFLGERFAPALRGKVDGLNLTNATPGKIAAALATGIIRNLKNGIDPNLLKSRAKIIGSGNAVRLLKSIRIAIDRELGLPLELSAGREEAAVGAAKLASRNVR